MHPAVVSITACSFDAAKTSTSHMSLDKAAGTRTCLRPAPVATRQSRFKKPLALRPQMKRSGLCSEPVFRVILVMEGSTEGERVADDK